jgi:hypothetical protein
MDESLYPIEGDIPFLRAIGTFQMDLSHGIPREMFTPRGLLVKFSERSFEKGHLGCNGLHGYTGYFLEC